MADSYEDKCGPLLSPRHRQYIDHRTGYTKSGFATREDSSPPDIDGRPKQAKSEIKNRDISDQLRAFADDLQRIEKYYSHIEQDRDEFYHLLHRNEAIIESLQHEIQRWKTLVDHESERMDKVEQSWRNRRVQLQDILSPLYNGLQDSPNAEHEFQERYNALQSVCEKELTELFEYLMEASHDEQFNQPDLKQERGGWNWQKQATERLENGHELVEGEWWGDSHTRKAFSVTERGEAVYEALQSLLESEYIDEWQNGEESREKAAFRALSESHNVEI
jgi:hypothetical protein